MKWYGHVMAGKTGFRNKSKTEECANFIYSPLDGIASLKGGYEI